MGTLKQQDIFVSLVSVLGSEHSASVIQHIRESIALLQDCYSNFELVLVDNDSPIEVIASVRSLLDEIPSIRVIRLSRKRDYDSAIFSGMDAAIGDFTVVFEIGSDPVSAVPEFVDQLVSGADIVQGNAVSKDSITRRTSRNAFFWFSRVAAGLDVPREATYFASFSRRSLNAMVSSPTSMQYLRHLLRHIGFDVVDFKYEKTNSFATRSRLGLVEAIELMTSYSLRPLRAVSWVGVIAALANLIYAAYVLFAYFSMPVERGWTTTNLQLGFMFFVLFLSLAVISEYLGRILIESRKGPSYIVMEELVSSRLIADENRRNIG